MGQLGLVPSKGSPRRMPNKKKLKAMSLKGVYALKSWIFRVFYYSVSRSMSSKPIKVQTTSLLPLAANCKIVTSIRGRNLQPIHDIGENLNSADIRFMSLN